MSTTLPQTSSAHTPALERVFKSTAVITFLWGFLMHTSSLIVGREPFVRNVMTPPVDVAFGLFITIPAITGLMLWRRYSGGRAARIGYGFALFLIVVSVPLHLRTLLTWSTDYLLAFPLWYSAIEVPMFLGLAYLMTRLKFDGPKKA